MWIIFGQLWVETAPWFLLGLILSAFLHGFIPTSWVTKLLGNKSKASIFTAAIIGAPLPLCSCSVVPVGLSIRQKGASKAATISFFVSTPETGVDSISLTYALMGPVMAVVRPFAAVLSALVAGFLTLWWDSSQNEEVIKEEKCSCSCGKKEEEKSFKNRLKEGFYESFGPLLGKVSFWLVIGIALAALAQTYLSSSWLEEWGMHPVSLFIMLLAGIPMYVCASGATPLAAGLMALGLSPGAALVFLLSGPATNIGTIAIIKKELGTASMMGYLVGVSSVALLLGYLLNTFGMDFFVKETMTHEGHFSVFSLFCGGILALLVSYSLLLKGLSFFKKPQNHDCCGH